MEMLEAGADAYVIKDREVSDLIDALRAVARGRRYLSPPLASDMADTYINRGFNPAALRGALGDREREVVKLVAEGHSSKAIASKLDISPTTVDAHRRNAMAKLGLHNVADLTRYAIRHGITEA
jgi:two-component system NarL family response regulator